MMMMMVMATLIRGAKLLWDQRMTSLASDEGRRAGLLMPVSLGSERISSFTDTHTLLSLWPAVLMKGLRCTSADAVVGGTGRWRGREGGGGRRGGG